MWFTGDLRKTGVEKTIFQRVGKRVPSAPKQAAASGGGLIGSVCQVDIKRMNIKKKIGMTGIPIIVGLFALGFVFIYSFILTFQYKTDFGNGIYATSNFFHLIGNVLPVLAGFLIPLIVLGSVIEDSVNDLKEQRLRRSTDDRLPEPVLTETTAETHKEEIPVFIKRFFWAVVLSGVFCLSVFIIYYYSTQTVIQFSNAENGRISIMKRYLFPRNDVVSNYFIRADNSLLVHLWDPASASIEDGVSTGQLFLYQPGRVRTLLHTGTQESAKMLGKKIHEIYGIETVITRKEGLSDRVLSKEILPATNGTATVDEVTP